MGINYKIPPGSAYNDVFVFRCRPAIGVLDAMSIRYVVLPRTPRNAHCAFSNDLLARVLLVSGKYVLRLPADLALCVVEATARQLAVWPQGGLLPPHRACWLGPDG